MDEDGDYIEKTESSMPDSFKNRILINSSVFVYVDAECPPCGLETGGEKKRADSDGAEDEEDGDVDGFDTEKERMFAGMDKTMR